jgi:NADH-quinone oxidoreductase subunit F
MDDTSCMVDIARYFLEFTQHESCGKCTFCRVGTRRMLEILERFCAGEASRRDLTDLEELCERVSSTSLCGLGSTAPNPILTTLRYFRHEYEAHLDGHCPAGKCTALIEFTINEKCIGCTLCAQQCPTNAIAMKPHELHEIDQEKCVQCGSCRDVCPVDAVDVE